MPMYDVGGMVAEVYVVAVEGVLHWVELRLSFYVHVEHQSVLHGCSCRRCSGVVVEFHSLVCCLGVACPVAVGAAHAYHLVLGHHHDERVVAPYVLQQLVSFALVGSEGVLLVDGFGVQAVEIAVHRVAREDILLGVYRLWQLEGDGVALCAVALYPCLRVE